MLQLSISHEEWRFLQFAIILSSIYQIGGSAHRLYDKYKLRQKDRELEKVTKELERIKEQLNRISTQHTGPPYLNESMARIREEQRRRVERGEAPQSPDEVRRLLEREIRAQQLQGPHELRGDDGGAAPVDEGHGIEGETAGG